MAEAEIYYQSAIDRDPDYALAHTSLAKLLLRRGEFQEGWKEYEWRWKCNDFPSPKRNFAQPQWTGQDMSGQRLLVHAEQGLGDTIQFARYVPMLIDLGAHVFFEVHHELVEFMGTLNGNPEIIAKGSTLPTFDMHCPLMSVPLAMRTTAETIPCSIPYLKAASYGSAWIPPKQNGNPHIGLVWAGNPTNSIDEIRSLTLSHFEGMLSLDSVKFLSFQRGKPIDEKLRNHLSGCLPETCSLAETASALLSIDLLITVDTAMAHAAGALGIPVWILLPYTSDWRWLEKITHNPWYPSARLFRQNSPGQWGAVLAEVHQELIAWRSMHRQASVSDALASISDY